MKNKYGTKETMTVILQYHYIYIFILFVLTFSWHEAHSLHHVAPGRLVKGARREEKILATDEEDEAESVMAGVSSVSRWGEHWTRLDFKNKDVKVAGNLVANTDAVTQQVEKGNDLWRKRRMGGQSAKLLLIIIWTPAPLMTFKNCEKIFSRQCQR